MVSNIYGKGRRVFSGRSYLKMFNVSDSFKKQEISQTLARKKLKT